MSINLPMKYKPFKEVWVCNNYFNYGQVLFEIDNNPVLLIGSGKKPSESFVWLKVPSEATKANEWVEVISANKVKSKEFNITTSDYGKEISFRDVPLIQFKVISKKLVINLIDFRSIGLNIFGGLSSLKITGHTLTNNTFSNVHTMISIGE
ncbi:hypothetical protein KUH14_004411 [Vibrio parahaemolyticus]|nr:hypothetical protein [Vibrio parahaemolyticus]EHR0831238.1 hypothetical protein [Vibrio parahaemolyticus]EHR1158893.1 hypothetical protein [Vibrio parahaemolyticus]EHR5011038.1 hypothetical protein [Vibrio parahaemolyticus]